MSTASISTAVGEIRLTTEIAAAHHVTHRGLLSPAVSDEQTTDGQIDAIVVPTVRHPAQLATAIDLARTLGTTLVLLCSRWSDHVRAAKLAGDAGIEAAAIDVNVLPPNLVPSFETTKLLAGTKFERTTDTSTKRNLGLLLSRLVGWDRIVFLDDDITIPNPQDLRTAVGLLDKFDGVGLANGGYPDNSVVCHAHRETGADQDTFIGGGALAVRSAAMDSFFPNIYNEDWFFLLDETRLRPSAITGLAVQRPYDPFANDVRARSEEFGDCLAEGVFSLLDKGGVVNSADTRFWKQFLADRSNMISEIIERAEKVDLAPAEKRRMLSALKAARGRCHLIAPQMCVDYLAAWYRDCRKWRDHVDELVRTTRTRKDRTKQRDLEKVLVDIGLEHRTEYVRLGTGRR